MAGFFGTVSTSECITDVFYGTDYNSHLGTRRGGMATYSQTKGFKRSIHNLESSYFRTKFEGELKDFEGNSGIGIISDTDAQPLLFNSHLGRFAICTVAKINNLDEIASKLLKENMHLSEFSSGKINPTELVALLIIKGKDFVEGIENVFREVKGSCTMLLLTEDGIIAARDSWGRTPIVIGKKDGAYAATSESTSFPNLGYEIEKFLGPGEIAWNSFASLTRRCRFARSCGFTTDSRLQTMRVETPKRFATPADTLWARRTRLRLTVPAEFQTRAWAWQ